MESDFSLSQIIVCDMSKALSELISLQINFSKLATDEEIEVNFMF